MKLWQKIFLMTLTLVIIVVNATSLILLTNNHNLAIEREQATAVTRHDYLVTEMQNTIIYTQLVKRIVSLSDEEALAVAFDVMDRQRSDATVGVALFEQDSAIHSVNDPPLAAETALLPQPDYSSSIVTNGNATYLLLVSSVTLNNQPYRLVSSYDISSTYTLFDEEFNQVRVVGIVSALLVAGILLMLVRILLNPLRNLSGTTRQIAGGDLEKRAPVRGNDEVSEVARNLNTMADSIEHNVTELTNLAESRRVFIGNLAHEMKTPLTSILGFADLLRVKRDVSDEDRIEYADVIVSETRRLQGLSSKLMELLAMGNTRLTLEKIDLRKLSTELAVALQQIFASQKISFAMRLPPGQIAMTADRELVKSLIYNLVDNAIKASSPGATVIFSVEMLARTASGGPAIVLAVADEGSGIPADQIPLLTEPFYMLDKARTRKAGGAGLGLALCVEIARVHGGHLEIESELGRGTRVSVTFPRIDSSPAQGVNDG
ncbi:MAG: HAMP domain-containing histidine kinase [Coriobacteriales bacterium]|jgi:signal transduction histidine kinase|nr:HAMP domain-containing histidine kinase [Coriobacteriales bacterium]